VLEEADKVIVSAYGVYRSLCVVLSNNSSLWGDGGYPERCQRYNGAIEFPGDWCAGANTPATAGCFDAVRFDQSFAAAAVQING
jgi:hypothetical protein